MTFIKRHSVSMTVTATGGATQAFYSDMVHNGGFIEAVRYVPATVSGMSTAAKLTLTGERSGIAILAATTTASATGKDLYPRSLK